MNSRNHVMLLGDLLICFYEDLAGIKNTPASVGFKQILMEPVFPEKLNYVNACLLYTSTCVHLSAVKKIRNPMPCLKISVGVCTIICALSVMVAV